MPRPVGRGAEEGPGVESKPKYWLKSTDPAPFNRRFLNTPLFDLARIGTDPSQAADFASRFALVPDPFPLESKQALDELDPQQVGTGGPTQAGGEPAVDGPATITRVGREGLRVITEDIRERAYKEAGLSDAEQARVGPLARAQAGDCRTRTSSSRTLKYKARPLDGVWATPPYLHNASVPNLDALLSPVAAAPGVVHDREHRVRHDARRLPDRRRPVRLHDRHEPVRELQHRPRVPRPDAARAGALHQQDLRPQLQANRRTSGGPSCSA